MKEKRDSAVTALQSFATDVLAELSKEITRSGKQAEIIDRLNLTKEIAALMERLRSIPFA